jgi:antirestriction protein ArdC
MKINDLYSSVTAVVIKQLEDGVPPWIRPWRDERIQGVGMIPSNLVSGRRYTGGNILLLWLAAHLNGYSNLQFCTYQQVNSIGATVRKGERATHVIFTKHIMREEDGEQRGQTIVKSYPVFNLSQLDKVAEQYLVPQQAETEGLPENASPSVILARGCRVNIQFGGNQACYIPSKDEVQMPRPSSFVDDEAYWQTLMHELIHATAHEKRCNRKLGKRFGDEQYAFEELVAELGSAFLCARLGIPAGYRSASYLDNWLKVLKQDTRAIFTAASYAGQGADYLWNTAFPKVEEKQLEAAE